MSAKTSLCRKNFNLLPLVGEWLHRRALSDSPTCQIHWCWRNHTCFHNLHQWQRAGVHKARRTRVWWPFSGALSGVQKRMRVHTAHALYTSTSLPMSQVAAGFYACSWVDSSCQEDVWYNGQPVELFYYSPKKADALKEVQSVLTLPELRRWNQVTSEGYHMNDVCELFIKSFLPW